MDLDKMTRAYLECALFADYPEDGPDFPTTDIDLFDDESRALARDDCWLFAARAADLIREAQESDPTYGDDRIGHDLWLSRNGHGSGFFDRPGEFDVPEEVFEDLQKLAREQGERGVFVGDDGKVFIE